jgi:hypothetical protein
MPLARVLPFSTSPRPPRFPQSLELAKLLEVAERLEPDALALIINAAGVMATPKGGARR